MAQRTLFEAFGVGRTRVNPHVDKPSKDQVMHDLFGTPPSSECDVDSNEDDESEDVESENVHTHEALGKALEFAHRVDVDQAKDGVNANKHVAHKRGASSRQKSCKKLQKKKMVGIRKYRKEWEITFPFLKLVVDGDKERMKCMWCEKFNIPGPWGRGTGCKTIMKGAIRKHHKSDEHTDGRFRWFNENARKMPEHVVVMQDRCRDRVITCMKLAYFVAQQDLALMKYESLCELANEIGAKDMPLQKDYSSYTNALAGKKFLLCVANHLALMQKREILSSPCYALMLDESTDRGHAKHLIAYIAFLAKAEKGQCKCEFLQLSIVVDGCAQTKYDAIIDMISELGLDAQRMVGIATDGDASMLGCHDGLVAKLVRDIPHLISVHCVAHREALAVLDACKTMPCLDYVDKMANKVYSWISASNLRHAEFQNILREMSLLVLEVLRIHDVRWLARGSVMARLTKVLPAILSLWKKEALAWYNKLRIYKVLFSIHMLAEVLHDLDILNKTFQTDMLDVISFSTSIDVTLSSLRRKFLSNVFAKDTLYLKAFMDSTKDGILCFTNDKGEEHVHRLEYKPIPLKDKNGEIVDKEGGDVNTCIALAKCFVEQVISCVNARFPDMFFFNAGKLFSPQHYPREEEDREAKTTLWLSRLLGRPGGHVVDIDGCNKELKSFVDTLYYGCEGMNFKDAWRVFSSTPHWHETFPNMLKLWQVLAVLPISSVLCERGFSKQNLIKTDRRHCLKVETLEMLMRVSLLGPRFGDVDWEKVYEVWDEVKNTRPNDL